MGWTKGLGADLARKVEDIVSPTGVFALMGATAEDEQSYAAPTAMASGPGGPRVHTIESVPPSPSASHYTAADHRNIAILSYFHAAFPHQPPSSPYASPTATSWHTTLPLCAQPPYEIDWRVALDKLVLTGAGTGIHLRRRRPSHLASHLHARISWSSHSIFSHPSPVLHRPYSSVTHTEQPTWTIQHQHQVSVPVPVLLDHLYHQYIHLSSSGITFVLLYRSSVCSSRPLTSYDAVPVLLPLSPIPFRILPPETGVNGPYTLNTHIAIPRISSEETPTSDPCPGSCIPCKPSDLPFRTGLNQNNHDRSRTESFFCYTRLTPTSSRTPLPVSQVLTVDTMDFGLHNVHVLITGASGGIGLATVRKFLRQYCPLPIILRNQWQLCLFHATVAVGHEVGARVTAHYNTKAAPLEPLLSEFGAARIRALQADLTREADVERLFVSAAEGPEGFGPVQVVVINHAYYEARDVPIARMTLEQWESTFSTNLTSSFLVARQFLRGFEKATDDAKGEGGDRAHREHSGQIWGGGARRLQRDEERLKNEIVKIAPKGRVNAIAPGWVKTPMAEESLKDPNVVYRALATTPLKKVATPEDVAGQVVVMSSPSLSGHITGQVLMIEGGMEGRLLNERSDLGL
ncbi:hypothetical protein NUW54_g3872 [Trametes sanguinea]|uniref:Uncharacterized protein n=1 Tax=Trametes sanguinea TaxID=158606 RepID=A0ACC1Q172_9APHY|nr:hypothetical protein NUW54_g3872 [Trametes sanguinea]